jgi:hypothetical protein
MFSIAAKWWADQLRLHTDQGTNMGAEGEQKFFISAMASTLPKPTKEQIDVFETTLKNLLLNGGGGHLSMAEHIQQDSHLANIGVDYNPGPYLAEAVQMVFDRRCFGLLPFKTRMWFSSTELRVRGGYHGECEILFKKETNKPRNVCGEPIL